MQGSLPAVDEPSVRVPAPGGRLPDGRVVDAPIAIATFRLWRPVPGRDGPPMLGYVGIAIGLGGLYALGALLPFWYLKSPEAGAAFFPSAGLTLAVLLLTPRRTWPIWLAVIGVSEFLVDITHGQRAAMAIGFAFANMLEPLVGAAGSPVGRGSPTIDASRRSALSTSSSA